MEQLKRGYLVPKPLAKSKRPPTERRPICFGEIKSSLLLITQKPLTAEPTEPPVKIYRQIIDGYLYTTEGRTPVTSLTIRSSELWDIQCFCSVNFFETFDLYAGDNHFFVVIGGQIYAVPEEWVKNILGKYDIDKYIEIFGDVPLA